MGRRADEKDRDRFLQLRNGFYQYRRRVPAKVAHIDKRAPDVRVSLETDDIALARQKRDLFEEADNQLWASMLINGELPTDAAAGRYQATVRRAEALGLDYRQASEIASAVPFEEIMRRVEAYIDGRTAAPIASAVLGGESTPKVKVSDAYRAYKEEIVPDQHLRKSAGQKAKWAVVKQRAIDRFVEVNGDIDMAEITREHAKKLYDFWRKRIAPTTGVPTHTASSGNREIGNMRVLYRDYFAHLGQMDRINPFDRLNFKERKKRIRPPFPSAWIRDVIMKPGALAGLNAEARGVLLAMIETGARPSEICNIDAKRIVLDGPVPHLKIETRDDPEDPREIKTESSERVIPLVGVSLAVFKRHPHGFPRYKDRESAMSAAINKFLRENKLKPSAQHKLYSLRHSFEDRMKEANLDTELRKMLMGHSNDRPKYGEGGGLDWRQKQLKRIVLPYDPVIV